MLMRAILDNKIPTVRSDRPYPNLLPLFLRYYWEILSDETTRICLTKLPSIPPDGSHRAPLH